MSRKPRRLRREWNTIKAMVDLYCRGHHHPPDGHCPNCSELLAYAESRLEKCPFQMDKPPCAKCPIHCYQPARREQIKSVMRFSGPRMMLHHPLFALRHWLDGFKKVPPKPTRQTRTSLKDSSRGGSQPGTDSSR